MYKLIVQACSIVEPAFVMFAGNNLEIQFIIFIFGKTDKNINYETKF